MFKKTVLMTAGLLVAGVGSVAYGQCAGEPASVSSCAPRIIPGTPGVHDVVMDVSTALPGFAMACGFNTGHSVWFSVTPTVSGQLTFSTCRAATSYDTVLQPWRSTGDCEFPQRLDDLCLDDSPDASCETSCAFSGSMVTIQATANTTYLFQVGSYNDNSADCTLCLGARAIICGGDQTPPDAVISSPAALACACTSTPVVGTANDSDGALDSYTLEYRPSGSGVWTSIGSSSTPVINGVLGTWDTTGLAQGWHFLRLTATNTCGIASTAVTVVMVDKQFDNLQLRSPTNGAVVGGNVCPDGTAWDQCYASHAVEYAPAGNGSFSPVIPADPTYSNSVLNDPLLLPPGTVWDTVAGIPDGLYDLRLTGTTACGHSAGDLNTVFVDNTAPTAVIADPINCDYLEGVVPIIGTANDANLTSWTLQYSGGASNGWVTIDSGNASVIDNLFTMWDTTALPACAYTLRLVVTDAAMVNCNGAIRHRSEFTVSVNLGFCGDFDADDDGDVDLIDYAAFQEAFTGP